MANKEEQTAWNIVRQTLNIYMPQFEQFNIQPRLLDIAERRPEPSLTSEIEIHFLKGSELIDVIEFFVFHNGKLSVDLNSLDAWLNKEINDLLERTTGIEPLEPGAS